MLQILRSDAFLGEIQSQVQKGSLSIWASPQRGIRQTAFLCALIAGIAQLLPGFLFHFMAYLDGYLVLKLRLRMLRALAGSCGVHSLDSSEIAGLLSLEGVYQAKDFADHPHAKKWLQGVSIRASHRSWQRISLSQSLRRSSAGSGHYKKVVQVPLWAWGTWRETLRMGQEGLRHFQNYKMSSEVEASDYSKEDA